MNIKFGMDNFYVRYLKRFINHELIQSKSILGKFDKNDLELLIRYLNLPNVKDMFVVQKEITSLFPQLKALFNLNLKDDLMFWTSKKINKLTSVWLMDNATAIREYCKSVGWELTNIIEWIDLAYDVNGDGTVDEKDREIIYNIIYNGTIYPQEIMDRADINRDGTVDSKDLILIDSYLTSGKLYLEIKMSSRKNYFPNKDMLIFVNQFDGTFMYNYAIKDGVGVDNLPHYDPTGLRKIGLYKCLPGQKITIAHSTGSAVDLIIGCSPATLEQDLTSFMLQNVQEIRLRPGEGYEYTCSGGSSGVGYDANWVCIQCPSNYGALSGDREGEQILQLGDINFDGVIDMQDYHLLARYTATGPGSENYHWEATRKEQFVMDINKDGIVDVQDAIILKKYLDKDPDYPIIDPGLYKYNISEEADEVDLGNNVSNLLIIDGHYDRTVNIPFIEFVTDSWCIHDKFFNYLFNIAIHNYSESSNITYLQQLLKENYPEHTYDTTFFYPRKLF